MPVPWTTQKIRKQFKKVHILLETEECRKEWVKYKEYFASNFLSFAIKNQYIIGFLYFLQTEAVQKPEPRKTNLKPKM